MTQGKLKWFDPKKGYGFIKPDDGSKDTFLHISALEKANINENTPNPVGGEIVKDINT